MPKHEKASVLATREARRIVNPAETRRRRHFRPGPHHDCDMATPGECPEPVPGGKSVETIASDDPDDGIAIAERFDGVDGIRRSIPPQFHIGCRKRRLSGNGETQHFPSICGFGAGRAMWRPGGEDERDQSHAQGAPDGAGCMKVAHMNRIESTPKINPHLQRRGASPPATYSSTLRIIRPGPDGVTPPIQPRTGRRRYRAITRRRSAFARYRHCLR